MDKERLGDGVSGLALAALGSYIIAQARGWEFSGPDGPGPGFFPLCCGIAMVALSAALVVGSGLRRSGPGRGAIAWSRIGRALSIWLALAVSVAALKPLGFFVSFVLFTFFIVAVMYRRPLAVAASVAAGGSAACYLIFPLALGVPLPGGPLGF